MIVWLLDWWWRLFPRRRPTPDAGALFTRDTVAGLTPAQRWAARQALAAPGRFYGDHGTIHHTDYLDVETHDGEVVAVWFRCQMLPFCQDRVGSERAHEMRTFPAADLPRLSGVEVTDQ